MKTTDQDKLLTPKEIMRVLGVNTYRAMWSRVKLLKVPVVKVGTRKMVLSSQLTKAISDAQL